MIMNMVIVEITAVESMAAIKKKSNYSELKP